MASGYLAANESWMDGSEDQGGKARGRGLWMFGNAWAAATGKEGADAKQGRGQSGRKVVRDGDLSGPRCRARM